MSKVIEQELEILCKCDECICGNTDDCMLDPVCKCCACGMTKDEKFEEWRKSKEYPEFVKMAKYHDPIQYAHCCGKDILKSWVGWHLMVEH